MLSPSDLIGCLLQAVPHPFSAARTQYLMESMLERPPCVLTLLLQVPTVQRPRKVSLLRCHWHSSGRRCPPLVAIERCGAEGTLRVPVCRCISFCVRQITSFS